MDLVGLEVLKEASGSVVSWVDLAVLEVLKAASEDLEVSASDSVQDLDLFQDLALAQDLVLDMVMTGIVRQGSVCQFM